MQQQRSLKIAAAISLAVLGILLVGSVVFYKERMLFSDAAWIAYLTIDTGSFQIQAGRYGSFITQIFPIAGSKLGLPLRTILVLYSLSFNLFYLFAGWVLFVMRRYALVMLLTLFLTIFVSDAYFWTNNEVYQGITWMLLMFGTTALFYEKFRERTILFYAGSLPVFTLLAFLSIYTHPVVMIPTAFLWIFFCLSGKESFYRTVHSIVFVLIIAVIIAFKLANSTKHYYDGNILQNVFKADLHSIVATFTSKMADIFWQNLLHNHWLIAFIFPAGIIYLFQQKKYLLSIYTAGACVGYFILMCLSFSAGSRPYIESEWMSLTILAAAPFVYYLLPAINRRHVIPIVLFIFIIRLTYIAAATPRYTARITMIATVHDIMRQRSIKKAVIKRTDDRLEQKSVIGWALPLETLYTSILDNDSQQRTAICLTGEEINNLSPQRQHQDLLLPFRKDRINKLNKQYFRPDTTQGYSIYTYEEFFGDKIGVLASD